ncbi:MAG: hypothetical protein J6A37_11570 [Oscillospiraceae bacterium]|nr:hypothetical protein [Oscillospiraceae bacterium]
MSGHYLNDTEFEKCLSLYISSIGAKKQQYLEELCRFRTEGADAFWRDKITDERFLPYIMMCRSDEFSDYCAKRMEDYFDRLLEGMEYRDSVNEAYFLLHACLFKESDKLMNAYAKAARNYKEIIKKGIVWNGDIISQTGQPPFLYDRYEKESEHNCENTLFNAITDTLIVTAANAISLDGENETFTDKVKELYELYPDVFAEAGFFVHFVKDNSEAYDKFSELLLDPVTYPRLFWVLDGLSYENGRYEQGSPTFFTGENNVKRHISIGIDRLDIRWYRFFAEKCLDDLESFVNDDPFFASVYLRSFSVRMLEIINLADKDAAEYSRKYFRKSAVLGGNPSDYAGLIQCGCLVTAEELNELVLETAKKICEGKQRYCFHILFHFAGSFSKADRLAAARLAAEYLEANEHSERLRSQREVFFEQYECFLNGKPSIFEGE